MNLLQTPKNQSDGLLAALIDHAVAIAVGTGVLSFFTPDEPWHTRVIVAAGVYVFIKIAVRQDHG